MWNRRACLCGPRSCRCEPRLWPGPDRPLQMVSALGAALNVRRPGVTRRADSILVTLSAAERTASPTSQTLTTWQASTPGGEIKTGARGWNGRLRHCDDARRV